MKYVSSTAREAAINNMELRYGHVALQCTAKMTELMQVTQRLPYTLQMQAVSIMLEYARLDAQRSGLAETIRDAKTAEVGS